MKLIVKWDEPTPMTGRTYVKGCMKFKSDISEIKLVSGLRNTADDSITIGKCRMVSDDFGLWATDIEYSVDENHLDELLEQHSHESGTTDLSLSCYGSDRKIIDDATFNCLHRHVFTDVNIKEMFRDLKLSGLV